MVLDMEKKSNSWQYGHLISLKVQFLDIEAGKELFILEQLVGKSPAENLIRSYIKTSVVEMKVCFFLNLDVYSSLRIVTCES